MDGDNQNGSQGFEIDEAASKLTALFGTGDGDDNGEDSEPDDAEDGAEDELEEGEPEGEDESDDEESDDEVEQRKERLFTVKVNGEEAQVPLNELVAGYQRQADYTRKAMAVAEQRKAAEAEVQALRQERAQFAQWAQHLIAEAQKQAPAQVDWDRLRVEDPIQYAQAWADHQRWQQKQHELHMQHQLALQRNQQAEEQEKQRILQTEAQRLAEIVPEFGDPQKVEAAQRALIDYGRSQGFSDDELSNVYDHRTVAVLRKAMLYDQLQRQRVTLSKRPSGPVAAPGGRSPGAPVTNFRNQMKQLRKTGSTADAAAAIAALIK